MSTARTRRAASQTRTLRVASVRVQRDRRAGQILASDTSQASLVGRLRKRLASIAQHLGRDELAVLTLVAERLRNGRSTYGELHLATDTRNFAREALEEAADMAVYTAAGLLRTGREIQAVKTNQRWR